MARTPAILLLSLLGAISTSSLVAQTQGEYILKNGQRYPADIVKPNGAAFVATVPLADNQQVFNFTTDDIEKLNFPEPDDLAIARRLTATGKAADALALIQKTLPTLQPLRHIPGSWWSRGVIIQMDAYSVLGKKPELEAEASAALQAKLPDTQAESIRNFLTILTQTSSNVNESLDAIKAIAAATTDSWIASRCWIESGNLLTRRGRTEDAVKAWLRSPVFHPTERDLAARGTILAARGLQQMERPEDGLHLIEYYLADNLGTPYSEVMKIEAAKLNTEKLKNSNPKASDNAKAEETKPKPDAGTPTSP